MPEIKQLSPHLINLIKAGEVIENIASVVKELVENSIDADSNIINIQLQDAGFREIVVADNGCGMDANDARSCILPHTTSKISEETDLFNINTLGFRGEALSSIVAVSNFKLKTCSDGSRGYMFTAQGGRVASECLLALPRGTEITVRNLFYNTVARLQHLKSEPIELSHVSDLVARIALANPHIAFKLTNNNKMILQTFGTKSTLEVIDNIYGTGVAKEMIAISNINGFFRISGYISKLNVTRSTRNHINLIVNGRIIRNTNLLNSVCEGYKTFLPMGRFPICIIDVLVDPSLVDVNIHPTKAEVKFSNEDELVALVTSTIASSLSRADLTVSLDRSKKNENNTNSNEEVSEENFSYAIKSENKSKVEIPQTSFEDFTERLPELEEIPFVSEVQVEEKPKIKYYQQEYSFDGTDSLVSEQSPNRLPKLFYIGQLFGTYILSQTEEHFYIIDQHAANERINYEKILKEFKKETILQYELTIPIKLTFTSSEAILIEQNLDKITNLGIKLDNFGSGTFMVREIPIWIFKGKEKEFVEEIIMHIINGSKTEKYQFLDSLAKSLACKRSVRGNEYLSKLQIEYILEDLQKCDNPFTCPHGRPIIMKYSKYEVEKWFKRV